MSYSLIFWAAPLDALVDMVKPVPGEETPESAARRSLGALWKTGELVDSVSHSGAGGTWFRDEFVAGVVAALIGTEAAYFLLDRELAGTRWDGYPSMGWLTRTELAEAVARLDEAGDETLAGLDDPESAELLGEVIGILRATAATGRDLVTLYI
jgi:hypothetical protein